MGARKIESWHRAGLIDAATRDRLIAHEAAHAKPVALWAVFGIGALTIALGLVSVVAANWEAIPAQLRLGVHLALIVGGCAALLRFEERLAAVSPWAAEALLFVTAALGLTFFGHLGQVYQTDAPLWQPLGLWLLLFAPLLLLLGRGWPSAAALVGASVWCAWEYATAATDYGAMRDPSLGRAMWLAFVLALPVLYAPIGAALRVRASRPDFWRQVEEGALAYAVAAASLATVVAGADGFGEGQAMRDWSSLAVAGAVGLLAGLATARARPGVSGRMAGAILVGAGLVVPLAYPADGLTLPAALLFFVLWGGIAAAALAAQWRGVFQLAVGAIALRLIVLSFELAGDLLASGFGLILAGVLILAVAWAAVRVSRRYAPREGGAA